MPPRRGSFYRQGLTPTSEPAYVLRQFPAMELNGSFYALQRPGSYERCAQDMQDMQDMQHMQHMQDGLAFTLKALRFIT